MHYAQVKVCVAVGDINPKYPLITQPDNVCLSFENYMCIGFVAFLLSSMSLLVSWKLLSSYFLLRIFRKLYTVHRRDAIVELCL